MPTGDFPDPEGMVWTDANGWVPKSSGQIFTQPLLEKRPVAWRVKDFADGWIIYQDEAAAYKEAEATGALMQGLYVRDGL